MDDPRLVVMTKRIYVNTCDEDYGSDDEEEDELSQEFKKMIRKLKNFPNVQSTILRFDKNFSDENREFYSRSHLQTMDFRTDAMRVFFSWLTSLPTPPQELGIQNLQYVNVKNPKVSDMIAKVLRELRSLRLSIVTEHDPAAPEMDLEFPEPHEFFSELPSTWLKPAMSSLEHLTLYCDNYFGFYPKLDLTGIRFPHLKTLSLGNYGFSQDSQLEWILSHAATLTELYLDDCTILYDAIVFEAQLPRIPFQKSEMTPRQQVPNFTNYGRSYDKRWHDFFDAFRTQLPLLRHFRMGRSEWMNGVPFETETGIKLVLVKDRYLACYTGYGPSPYMDHRHSPQKDEREPPTCDDEDKEALRLLLEKIGQDPDQVELIHQ